MKTLFLITCLIFSSAFCTAATVRVTNASLVPVTFILGELNTDYLMQESFGGVVLPMSHFDLNVPESANVSANDFTVWVMDDSNGINWAASLKLFEDQGSSRFNYEPNADVNVDQARITDAHDHHFTIRATAGNPGIYPFLKNDQLSIYKSAYRAGSINVAGIDGTKLEKSLRDGFIWGFGLFFPLLLTALILRHMRRMADANPSL